MKIIRITGDMPPCFCGESGGGGGTDRCVCDLPPCGVVDQALSCRDLPWEYDGVPMGACDPNCYDSFYITISASSTSPN
jgi:hypothetical protein